MTFGERLKIVSEAMPRLPYELVHITASEASDVEIENFKLTIERRKIGKARRLAEQLKRFGKKEESK